MRKLLLVAALALAPMLGGCSSTGLANFEAGLSNFTQGVAATNAAIAATSQQLYSNCKNIEAGASALSNLVSTVTTSSAAKQSLAGANAAIQAWCQAPPQDITSALVTTASIVTAVQSAVKAVKAGN